MPTRKEVLQMALDALVVSRKHITEHHRDMVMEALRSELAKPEPEPVGYFIESLGNDYCKHCFEQFADEYANDPDVVPLYREDV